MKSIISKIRRKLWGKLIRKTKNTKVYLYLYRSYWHYLFHKNLKNRNTTSYFTARPNPGAGIGHQLANWIAGYWFAKQFNLKFAHLPFSTEKWENFFDFGENEPKVANLCKQGYKKRRIPLFNEDKPEEIKRIQQIIASYAEEKIILVCEQDQFYHNQYGIINEIQQKFYNAPARKKDKLLYDTNNYNIAIHVRRGDIMTNLNNSNLQKRYLSNDYFKNVLTLVLEKVQNNKPIHIYFFSQGKKEDYPEFSEFKNLHWCFEMNAQNSFLHMVYADCLITSKSSFSYKPALLNKGIKVCPKNFWHGYPKSKDWILADNEGRLIVNNLTNWIE